MEQSPDAAQLLSKARSGDQSALDQLIPMVYEALRNLAGRMMQQERQDHTLQATALAHEAYLKLVGQRNTSWQEQARIVKMRFFAGLTVEEVASVLNTSTRTVERKWRHARAWLFRALTGNDMDESLEPGDDG